MNKNKESSIEFNWLPDVEFFFHYSPPEPQTFWEPGNPAEVNFTKIEINNQPISPELEELLLEAIGDKAEEEILAKGHFK